MSLSGYIKMSIITYTMSKQRIANAVTKMVFLGMFPNAEAY